MMGGRKMDNFKFELTAEGTELLQLAMKIMFSRRHKATHYKVDAKLGLVFYDFSYALKQEERINNTSVMRLPFTLDSNGAADFAKRWLAETNYGPEPDHDGDNGKGWHVYSGSWGKPDADDWHSFVAVQPAWAMYGK
jgi:hypothetical protein